MGAVANAGWQLKGLFLLQVLVADCTTILAGKLPAPVLESFWWSDPLEVASKTVLGKPDVYSCTVLRPPATGSSSPTSITQVRLQISSDASQSAVSAQLRHALLWDCDPHLWHLSGLQDSAEAACLTSTSVLRAACNQWPITVPAEGQLQRQSCAPHGTAFASTSSLRDRVLVLQTHWQLPHSAGNQAVVLPSLQLALGSATADAGAIAAAGSDTGRPALLGTFVGSGIYPPSHMSGSLQAFHVPASADGSATATAALACGKRCTYMALGRLRPKPVTVVAYSFETLGRAVNVSFEIKRGKLALWSSEVPVRIAAAPDNQGAVRLQQPFQLHPGDTVRWRCSYDMQPGSALVGGYSSDPAAQQEQCTVLLHYWPRVDAMRGCTAALDSDALLGENMCSSEAEDLMGIKSDEDSQFPMRRTFQEHSFPAASWMGGWKASHLVMQMALVLTCLRGFHTLLSTCTALGPIHSRFISLHAAQQRNVSLYLTHLVLDTAVLLYALQPMVELFSGLVETAAGVQPGMWGLNYLVACYALELTWRRNIDTMLAIHHTGTIIIILLYAGELSSSTYRVASNLIVLGSFAVMEQPTYVALLLKRMLPRHSIHVVRAARVGYISWFLLKGASVLVAVRLFVEDWHITPTWLRVSFIAIWVVSVLVQGWSGLIQRSIYKQAKHAHAKWEHKEQAKRERRAALALHVQTSINSSDTDGSVDLPSPCAASHGELCKRKLMAGRVAAVAGSPRTSPSPCDLIAGGVTAQDGEEAQDGGHTGCSPEDLSGSTSPNSSGAEDMICVLGEQQQAWGTTTEWQNSVGRKASHDKAAAL